MSIQAHTNWVRTCHFSPDAKTILSGSDDKLIKLWDATTGDEIARVAEHTGMINTARYHPDGSCFCTGATDKKIKIFDSRSQRLL